MTFVYKISFWLTSCTRIKVNDKPQQLLLFFRNNFPNVMMKSLRAVLSIGRAESRRLEHRDGSINDKSWEKRKMQVQTKRKQNTVLFLKEGLSVVTHRHVSLWCMRLYFFQNQTGVSLYKRQSLFTHTPAWSIIANKKKTAKTCHTRTWVTLYMQV